MSSGSLAGEQGTAENSVVPDGLLMVQKFCCLLLGRVIGGQGRICSPLGVMSREGNASQWDTYDQHTHTQIGTHAHANTHRQTDRQAQQHACADRHTHSDTLAHPLHYVSSIEQCVSRGGVSPRKETNFLLNL